MRHYLRRMKQPSTIELEIKQLELLSKGLSPDINERETARNLVIQYTEEFLEALPSKKAYVITEDKGKALLDSPIADEGTTLPSLISLVKENVDTPGLNPASGGHLGYIPGGGIYTSSLGDYMADISNRYAGIFFASPGAVRMENMLVDWMCRKTG